MGGLCQAGVKRQTGADQNDSGRAVGLGEIIVKTNTMRSFSRPAEVLALETEAACGTCERLTALIYELITALQPTSKLLYLFTHLSATIIFFPHFVPQSTLIFISVTKIQALVLFQVQICATMH